MKLPVEEPEEMVVVAKVEVPETERSPVVVREVIERLGLRAIVEVEVKRRLAPCVR